MVSAPRLTSGGNGCLAAVSLPTATPHGPKAQISTRIHILI